MVYIIMCAKMSIIMCVCSYQPVEGYLQRRRSLSRPQLLASKWQVHANDAKVVIAKYLPAVLFSTSIIYDEYAGQVEVSVPLKNDDLPSWLPASFSVPLKGTLVLSDVVAFTDVYSTLDVSFALMQSTLTYDLGITGINNTDADVEGLSFIPLDTPNDGPLADSMAKVKHLMLIVYQRIGKCGQ